MSDLEQMILSDMIASLSLSMEIFGCDHPLELGSRRPLTRKGDRMEGHHPVLLTGRLRKWGQSEEVTVRAVEQMQTANGEGTRDLQLFHQVHTDPGIRVLQQR